ncbi:putative map kinase kinase [Diplodia seriata]|uniref:Putative map kinase kinase n=1 Tax=Diplodia seriata TaxID=420778 RepID=A0A0G2DR65_9PEZI|nr:putative map kinase kinase [Diplodia seriata]
MARTNSDMSGMVLPDLEKLQIDKGANLEPGDLDNAGWRAASKESLIEELGSLGEGAGGAVTSKRIIHRDIKPSNILLSRSPMNPDGSRQAAKGSRLNAWEGIVKLCDFGVSGEFGTKGMADTFIGTSYYMAPERIQGLSYTITSDVWSLGVTLLEVAQGRFPFPADADGESGAIAPRAGLIDLLTYIVRQPIPKLKDEPKNNIFWGDGFKYFIECCLEKEPNRRATPWRMLEHPWMVEMRSKKVNMESFLAKVWEWKD